MRFRRGEENLDANRAVSSIAKSSKKSLKKLPEEVPFVCLAIPLDEPCKGLAFAHLPLPLETGLSDLFVKSGSS